MAAPAEHARAAADLQASLRDLLTLTVVGDHVRWVLREDDGELEDWLTDAVARWRTLADRLARHLAGLGVAPDGRVRSLAQDIPLNWVPDGWLTPDEARRLLAERLRVVAGWNRYRQSQAIDTETGTLLQDVCAGLERLP